MNLGFTGLLLCINKILDMKADHLDELSNTTPVAVGGTLSACLILIILLAVFVIR